MDFETLAAQVKAEYDKGGDAELPDELAHEAVRRAIGLLSDLEEFNPGHAVYHAYVDSGDIVVNASLAAMADMGLMSNLRCRLAIYLQGYRARQRELEERSFTERVLGGQQ